VSKCATGFAGVRIHRDSQWRTSVVAVGCTTDLATQKESSMRWYWIDKFVEFESGSRAKAVKNISLSEEHMHDHFPGFPVMPASLMIEGMAQTGGILLGEVNDFKYSVILAKVPQVEFHGWAQPGDQLIYEAILEEAREEGGSVKVTATVGDRLVADGEIMFVHLNSDDPQLSRIDQKNFVFRMNLMDIMDDGKARA
jgi:3-hydroxyacyl-[acyl-carrier-protein] dehydratase